MPQRLWSNGTDDGGEKGRARSVAKVIPAKPQKIRTGLSYDSNPLHIMSYHFFNIFVGFTCVMHTARLDSKNWHRRVPKHSRRLESINFASRTLHKKQAWARLSRLQLDNAHIIFAGIAYDIRLTHGVHAADMVNLRRGCKT
jgi:hypothetical protein